MIAANRLKTIYQVKPLQDNKVLLYFADGTVRLYDYTKIKERYQALKDDNFARERMTVLAGTLAWDIAGNRDEYKMIDVAPETLYDESVLVKENDYYQYG